MFYDSDGVPAEPDDAEQYDEEYLRMRGTHGHDATEYEDCFTEEDEDDN